MVTITSGGGVAGRLVPATGPELRETPGGGIRERARRLVWAGGAVAAGVAVAAVALSATSPGQRPPIKSGSPTAQLSTAGLPTFGTSHALEVNNPALNDVGDPYILPVAAGADGNPQPSYVLYWTTDWSGNVPTAVSTDLMHWERATDALPALPAWALVVRPPPSWPEPAGVSTMTWAPTVHQVGNGFVLYYSTEDASTRTECLGSAYSTNPLGPFVDKSTAPLVCQAALGGDIDPSVLTPSPGHLALVWKNDGNSTGAPVSIWEQALTPDGRATMGTPVRLLGADQAWEHSIIEGPAMLADTKGGWWLFYAGGTWQSNTYDTGVAWCATVSGPCREPATAPLLASVPTAVSPGGLDTFVDHQGTLWAAYSAFPSPPADARAAMASPRVLELAPFLSR